jgi:hypothetical protein
MASEQKMVCIKKGAWVNVYNLKPVSYAAPNYGEIVTVIGSDTIMGQTVFYLAEYPGRPDKPRASWAAKNFQRLVKDEGKADQNFINMLKGIKVSEDA